MDARGHGHHAALRQLEPGRQLQGRTRDAEADRQVRRRQGAARAGPGQRQPAAHAAAADRRRRGGCAAARRCRTAGRAGRSGFGGPSAGPARGRQQQLGGGKKPQRQRRGGAGQRPASRRAAAARHLASGGAVHARHPGGGSGAAGGARHPGRAHRARRFRRDQCLRRFAGSVHRARRAGAARALPRRRPAAAVPGHRGDDPHQGQGRAGRIPRGEDAHPHHGAWPDHQRPGLYLRRRSAAEPAHGLGRAVRRRHRHRQAAHGTQHRRGRPGGAGDGRHLLQLRLRRQGRRHRPPRHRPRAGARQPAGQPSETGGQQRRLARLHPAGPDAGDADGARLGRHRQPRHPARRLCLRLFVVLRVQLPHPPHRRGAGPGQGHGHRRAVGADDGCAEPAGAARQTGAGGRAAGRPGERRPRAPARRLGRQG